MPGLFFASIHSLPELLLVILGNVLTFMFLHRVVWSISNESNFFDKEPLQIRLSTCLVFLISFGAVMGAEITPRIDGAITAAGWPFDACETRDGITRWNDAASFLDFTTAFGLFIPLTITWELWQRRRLKHVPNAILPNESEGRKPGSKLRSI